MAKVTQEVEVARLDLESVDSQGHVLNLYAILFPSDRDIPLTLGGLHTGRGRFRLHRGHKTLSCTCLWWAALFPAPMEGELRLLGGGWGCCPQDERWALAGWVTAERRTHSKTYKMVLGAGTHASDPLSWWAGCQLGRRRRQSQLV